ncbi:MAG: hypothetical protein RL417_803 [Pseudomonadota bacterium]|jgi:hypothetical protein
MKDEISRDPVSVNTQAIAPAHEIETTLDRAETGVSRSPEERLLLEQLRETHRARATNLISIFPETPACAAAVFEALDRPQMNVAGLRFISRAMRAAAEKIESSRIRLEYGQVKDLASAELEREVWQNHHLLKRLLRASPELRRVIEALRAIVAAPGIINRLGEPGFVEAFVELLIEELRDHAAAFQSEGAPIEELRQRIAAQMDEFCPEFSAESLAQISPSSLILRRAGYHEHCAERLDDLKAA